MIPGTQFVEARRWMDHAGVRHAKRDSGFLQQVDVTKDRRYFGVSPASFEGGDVVSHRRATSLVYPESHL